MAGKIAVVTGGAAGIGFAIAAELMDRGVIVVIADVEEEALTAAAAALGATGVVADVTKVEDLVHLADEVIRLHGRLDIAVNNAGVARIAPFDELTIDDFRWVLDVNLWGVVLGMKVFLPLIESTSQCGYIVNTASIAGMRSAPKLAAYAVSKFGVVALTETVEQELSARASQVGLGVLVPAMVQSNIAASERNRPGVRRVPVADGSNGAGAQVGAMEAHEVGVIVADAIERGDLYIVTHPESLDSIKARHRRIEDAFEQAVLRSAPTL
ncbi:UNVERIFIED_ORG: NADP-dependent 3-hydroxy acid dehydrogenase YdfG [Nocardia globerula]|uniref:NADP-dependent 3-hydroxy acid dehydrogenase YdfG n=2 Tax=Nocardiaceae TaxID=85025 RepID=A0A652YSL6_NOCGL|nr:SDR family NAD(P)-dependent oxidoreductase [Nocardia globerula]PVX67077.1 NADP-dependent 3-hydroxy acid dehydrogenase YdfG [Rhodococcus globerulus]